MNIDWGSVVSTYLPLQAQSSTLGPKGLASSVVLTADNGILNDTLISEMLRSWPFIV